MLRTELNEKGGEVKLGSGLSATAMNNMTALKMRSDAVKSELAKRGEGIASYPMTTQRNITATLNLTGNANKPMHGIVGDAEVTAANTVYSLIDNLMKPVGATATIVEGVGAIMKAVASPVYLVIFCICFSYCLTFAYGYTHGEIAPFATSFFKWLAKCFS